MALASGLASQLGIIAESTFNTYSAPTRFYEYVNETVQLQIERVETKGLRAGRRVAQRWNPGVQRVIGDVLMELAPQNFGLWFKHMFGGFADAGAGDPWTHTYTPGDLSGLSLSIQIARPDISGVVRPFSYTGCVIPSWELDCATNQFAMLKVNIYGANEDTTQGLATASYPATLTPFIFTNASLTIAGSSYDVKNLKLQGNNGMAINRHFLRAATPAQPKIGLESQRRSYTGTLTSDFIDLTAYNRFVQGVESALVMTFDTGATPARKLVITMNVRYEGQTPNVKGEQLLDLTLPFEVSGNGVATDAAMITAVLTNGEATS